VVPSTKRRAAVALSVTVVLCVVVTMLAGPVAGAESPSPSFITPGDPRSDGVGPGLVGSPLFVAFVVLALGIGSAAATLLFARLTREE
jgi:hypothetical protein